MAKVPAWETVTFIRRDGRKFEWRGVTLDDDLYGVLSDLLGPPDVMR